MPQLNMVKGTAVVQILWGLHKKQLLLWQVQLVKWLFCSSVLAECSQSHLVSTPKSCRSMASLPGTAHGCTAARAVPLGKRCKETNHKHSITQPSLEQEWRPTARCQQPMPPRSLWIMLPDSMALTRWQTPAMWCRPQIPRPQRMGSAAKDERLQGFGRSC